MKYNEVVCCVADKEDDSDMNVVSSDCDRELTSVAMTTAALSMAAAAAANDADEGDDDDDGLRMCEVETRPLRPEFYSYVSVTHCSVIFVNKNENENGEKRENNEFVNEN